MRFSSHCGEFAVNMFGKDEVLSRACGSIVSSGTVLSVHPRWFSLSGLTLLLTASGMDPACEASLIVFG